jgi:hypothetical protein
MRAKIDNHSNAESMANPGFPDKDPMGFALFG